MSRNSTRLSVTALGVSGVLGLFGTSVIAQPIAQAAPRVHTAPKVGTVYVYNVAANFDQGSITEYAPNANGNAKPSATIQGSKTQISSGSTSGALAVGTNGDTYVLTETPSVVVFPPNASGNATPIAVISGSKTGLVGPTAVAVAPSGAVWVANGNASLLEFAPHAKGDVQPKATISGSKTGIGFVPAISVTGNGKDVWISTQFNPHAFEEFSTTAHGNVAPSAVISGSKTGLGSGVDAWGMTVASNGALWATETNTSKGGTTLVEFAAGKHGNVAPSRKISGSRTGLSSHPDDIFGLANRPGGGVWMFDVSTDPHGNTTFKLVAFGANASGNAKPLATISGSKTNLKIPSGIGVFSG